MVWFFDSHSYKHVLLVRFMLAASNHAPEAEKDIAISQEIERPFTALCDHGI
jgi:hypothetical protein